MAKRQQYGGSTIIKEPDTWEKGILAEQYRIGGFIPMALKADPNFKPNERHSLRTLEGLLLSLEARLGVRRHKGRYQTKSKAIKARLKKERKNLLTGDEWSKWEYFEIIMGWYASICDAAAVEPPISVAVDAIDGILTSAQEREYNVGLDESVVDEAEDEEEEVEDE